MRVKERRERERRKRERETHLLLMEMLLCRTTFGVIDASNDAFCSFDGDADGGTSLARRFADGTTDGDENSAAWVRAPDGVVERLMALWMPFMADKTLERGNRTNDPTAVRISFY